jgi:hypothetical protein
MALAKQPTARSSAGFGRRGTISANQTLPRSTAQRRPTISGRPDERTRETLAEAAQAVAANVNTSASHDLTLGAGLGVEIAMTSPPDEGKSIMMALATTASGFIGGFAFWRAQDYPARPRARPQRWITSTRR